MATECGPRSFGYLAEFALLVLLATLWGASYTFIKPGVESIPPVTFIAMRTAIAAAMLLGILRWRGIAMPTDLAVWRRFLFQANLNSVVPFTLIAWAEQSVDAGLATILNSAAPIFTFILTWCFARQQSATGRQLLGVISGMIGICRIVGVQALSGVGEQLTAQLAIIVATVCYAGAAIFGRTFQGLDPMLPATGSLLCGAIILIPISLVMDQPWTLTPSIRSVLALFCLSVFSTALAFTIYFRLIHTLGAGGHDSTGLSSGSDWSLHRRCISGRDSRPHYLDRACLRNRGCGRNDHSGTNTIGSCAGDQSPMQGSLRSRQPLCPRVACARPSATAA
jgi:drug/metabolite transporter (DMT)-like permease